MYDNIWAGIEPGAPGGAGALDRAGGGERTMALDPPPTEMPECEVFLRKALILPRGAGALDLTRAVTHINARVYDIPQAAKALLVRLQDALEHSCPAGDGERTIASDPPPS